MAGDIWTSLGRCPVGNKNRSKERGSWGGRSRFRSGQHINSLRREWLTLWGKGEERDMSQRQDNGSTGEGFSREQEKAESERTEDSEDQVMLLT